MSNISTAQASKSFLSQCDDLLTRLVLDYSVFGVPKLAGRATGKIEDAREPRMTDREVEEVRTLVQQLRKGAVKVDDALASLLKLTPARNFVKKWEDEDAAGIFANHAKRYILALRPDSGIAFHETDRYKNPRDKSKKGKRSVQIDTPARRDPSTFIEVGVFATRNFKKGEVVNLRGGIADLTEEEDDEMRDSGGRRDFSVLWSERKSCFCLLLGPARFVNHDCRNNVEFQLVGANMTFKVLEDIAKDEEIFTHYGDHYFDTNNSACLCATCEELAQGAFASKRKVAAPKPNATPAASPSRRSHRSSTLLAPDYNESRAASAPVASGSGHAATAHRSVRSSGLNRSSSLSALSGRAGASPRAGRIRPPSSRVVPTRGEASAVEALRSKPRGVVQPKLPPPPGYVDDYSWDQKKRIAQYVGLTTSGKEAETTTKKPSSDMRRSASAPSLVSLGKRKRQDTDSPAPSLRNRSREKKDVASSTPPAKKSRIAQVKLKAARLGERVSSRLANAVSSGSASARDRKFALLRKAMGGGDESDDSDLSSLGDDEEDEEGEPQDGSDEVDDDEEEAAVEEQLLSPQRHAFADSSRAVPTAPSTSATVSLLVSSTTTALANVSNHIPSSDVHLTTTSTPIEEVGTPSLHVPSENGEEDQILLCPVPDSSAKGKASLLSPATGFYATTTSGGSSSADGSGGGADAVSSQANTVPDFRFGRSGLPGGSNGSAAHGLGGTGGRSGNGGDDEDERRPPRRAIPVAPSSPVPEEVIEDSDGGDIAEEQMKGSDRRASATAGRRALVPPALLRADSLGSNDSRDAAAALLLLLCAPPSSTSATPPEEAGPSEASHTAKPVPTRRNTESFELAFETKPKARRRTSRLASKAPAPEEAPDVQAPLRQASPADAPRRTRSQPIAGRLQDVLSAPETLAAIGGFDWAKGKYISVKEATSNPSEDPRPPLRRQAESSSPSPPPTPPPEPKRRRLSSSASSLPPRARRSFPPVSPAASSSSQRRPRMKIASSTPVQADTEESPVAGPSEASRPSARSTRRSFPLDSMKLADLVYSPAARQVSGGWDPQLGKYVAASTTHADPAPATVRAEENTSKPEGRRATRRSLPMVGKSVHDIVYSSEARAAAGGWDPTSGKYVSAGSKARASGSRS